MSLGHHVREQSSRRWRIPGVYLGDTHTRTATSCVQKRQTLCNQHSFLPLSFPSLLFLLALFSSSQTSRLCSHSQVPSRRIPLGRRKVLSLCSRGIRIHIPNINWVIYILGHTCEFSVWNLRTQSSTFPWRQMGIYFLISEGGFWARGWGTSHRWGNFSQMAVLGLKRIFCREISSRLARLLELTGREEQKVVIC